MKFIILLTIILLINGFALTPNVIKKIQISHEIGKNIIAKDGMDFGLTLPAIMMQESSGIFVVGDKLDSNGRLKSLYDSSLGNYQIKLSTAKLTIRKYPILYKQYGHLLYKGDSIYNKYKYHKSEIDKIKKIIINGIDSFINQKIYNLNKTSINYKNLIYYQKISNNPLWISRYNNQEKKAIKTIQWATRKFNEHNKLYNIECKKIILSSKLTFTKYKTLLQYHIKKYNNLSKKASKDTRLINLLLTNFKAGSLIGGYYLLSCYNEALLKKFKYPWRKAIGRYNGGWNNTRYFNKVKNRFHIIKNIIN